MATLGGLTFGMYVWHPFVGPMVRQIPSLLPIASQRDVNVVDALEFVVYVVGTIGVAALAYGLVERPFLKLKTKYAQGNGKTAGRTRAPVVPWAYLFFGCSSGGIVVVYGARLALDILR